MSTPKTATATPTTNATVAIKNGQLSPKSVNESALTGGGDSDLKINESIHINNNEDKIINDDKFNSSDKDTNNINNNNNNNNSKDKDNKKKKQIQKNSDINCENNTNNLNTISNNCEENNIDDSDNKHKSGDKLADNEKPIVSNIESTSSSSAASPPPTSETSKQALSTSKNINTLLNELNEKVAEKLKQLFSSQKLAPADLDERAIEALKEFGNVDGALSVLNEFDESSLEHVSNKSAFLCGIMKAYRQKEKANKNNVQVATNTTQALNNTGNNNNITNTINNNNNNNTNDNDDTDTQNINNSGATEASACSSNSSNTVEQSHNSSNTSHNQNSHPGPDEAKLKAILDRTGYTLDVTSGQRKYGGPPPDWDGPMPSAGSEIFVGKIPKEIFEDELIPLFEKSGKIWDLRLMIDPLTGYSRGYAFITYCSRVEALDAQARFDSYEIRKGKCLKVNISVPNLRLFIGNIPKSKTKEEIYQEFTKLTSGLLEVIVYSSPDDRKRNRGFCFLEFESHKAASLAKRKLSSGRMKIWGCDILVDWADPQEEPDQETMSKVKVLYARNLTSKITEDQLRELFEKYGSVERVKKIKDYAFIHFDDRDNAIRAMNELNGKELNGVRVDISLAKPPSDRKKKEEVLRNRERRVMLMMQQRALIGAPRAPLLSSFCFSSFASPQAQPQVPSIPPAQLVTASRVRNRPIAAASAAAAAAAAVTATGIPTNILSPPTYGHRPVPRGYYHVMPATAAPILNPARVRNRPAATLPTTLLSSAFGHRPFPRGYYNMVDTID